MLQEQNAALSLMDIISKEWLNMFLTLEVVVFTLHCGPLLQTLIKWITEKDCIV